MFLALVVLAAVRRQLAPREWLFPLCIVGGTVLALVDVRDGSEQTPQATGSRSEPLSALDSVLSGRP